MKTLEHSLLRILYYIPGLQDDFAIINTFTTYLALASLGILLVNIKSPVIYGRYGPNKNIGDKWLIKSRIVWLIAFFPIVVILTLELLDSPCKRLSNIYNLIAFTGLSIHYINRYFIYALKISDDAKPISVSPASILLASASVDSFALQTHHLANVHNIIPSSFTLIGVFLFITGMIVNIYHDNLLLRLRPHSQQSTNKTSANSSKISYKIPHGGLFRFVSCPNYFGEVVEWWGFAIISGELPQITLAVWTTCFLVPRALYHHKFYLKTFTNYPVKRKAIIPFLV